MSMRRKCPWCLISTEPCDAVSAVGYHCTRYKGHSGVHVACGPEVHPIYKFGNQEGESE